VEQRRASSMAVTELARSQETAATLRERVLTLERERGQLQQLREQLRLLALERDNASHDAQAAASELAALRSRLHAWSETVERALAELTRAAGSISAEGARPNEVP